MLGQRHARPALDGSARLPRGSESRMAPRAPAVRGGSTLLVSGGADSGRTTFLNSLGLEIPVPQERLDVIDGARELQLMPGAPVLATAP